MRISLIAALSRDRVIGNETGMPWHIPHDLKRFKALTWGKPIILGRKTHAILGRPLPGRENIVLTHDTTFQAPGVQVASTMHGALALAEQWLSRTDGDEVMIIGGAQVYQTYLPLAQRLYLSVVEGDHTGTVFFPDAIPELHSWTVSQVDRCDVGTDVPIPYTFVQMDRPRPRLGSLSSVLAHVETLAS